MLDLFLPRIWHRGHKAIILLVPVCLARTSCCLRPRRCRKQLESKTSFSQGKLGSGVRPVIIHLSGDNGRRSHSLPCQGRLALRIGPRCPQPSAPFFPNSHFLLLLRRLVGREQQEKTPLRDRLFSEMDPPQSPRSPTSPTSPTSLDLKVRSADLTTTRGKAERGMTADRNAHAQRIQHGRSVRLRSHRKRWGNPDFLCRVAARRRPGASFVNAVLATALFRCWHILIFYSAWATLITVLNHNGYGIWIESTLLTV